MIRVSWSVPGLHPGLNHTARMPHRLAPSMSLAKSSPTITSCETSGPRSAWMWAKNSGEGLE